MIIEIDFQTEVPIYTQLVNQIKLGVYQEKLKPGDSLPSVRSLAGDIGINLHTVNKAYKILVGEGVVTQVKKGYEISSISPPNISSDYYQVLEKQVENLLIDTKIFDIDLEKLISKTTKQLKGEVRDD